MSLEAILILTKISHVERVLVHLPCSSYQRAHISQGGNTTLVIWYPSYPKPGLFQFCFSTNNTTPWFNFQLSPYISHTYRIETFPLCNSLGIRKPNRKYIVSNSTCNPSLGFRMNPDKLLFNLSSCHNPLHNGNNGRSGALPSMYFRRPIWDTKEGLPIQLSSTQGCYVLTYWEISYLCMLRVAHKPPSTILCKVAICSASIAIRNFTSIRLLSKIYRSLVIASSFLTSDG
jgi:hypothetical protein